MTFNMTTNQNIVPSGESEVEMQQEQPLAKIPIEALYKLSRQEVGEWKSYAQELEDKVKVLEKRVADMPDCQLTKEDYKEVRMRVQETVLWKGIKSQVSKLQARVKQLKRLNQTYICRICELQNEIARLKGIDEPIERPAPFEDDEVDSFEPEIPCDNKG